MSFFWSLAFLAVVPLVMAYPTGAPLGTCVNLTPKHFNSTNPTVLIPPQAGPSPYALSVSKNMYSPSEELTVTVTSDTGDYFEGFLLQARLADDTLVGTFSDPPTNNTKLLQCTDLGDSVTHTSSARKDAGTSFTWTAPSSDVGNVTFTATFVLQYDEFWVKVTSQEIMASTGAPWVTVNSALIISLLGVVFVATKQ
ncbi:putative defense protein 3 [Strongylocentrotus purpuratus]|uniref:Reelin domain-containing protein n=1 Tax=Strongylocentrotus purpuratus TaxID=7668 RepID=A0A7M7NIP4_STRPU|nr:putative defense protein 3 [Strongylocentrotus purpuratus]